MRLKRMILRSLILLFALILVGCNDESTNGGQEDQKNSDEETQTEDSTNEQVELRVAWWGAQDRHDRTLQVIELFEKNHPNITILPEYTGWDGYWEKLNTQAAGSNLPDIIQMGDTKMNEYLSHGTLMDLAPFIDEGIIDMSNVDDVYQDINVEGEKVWAISLGAGANGAIYNQTLWDEAGINLEPGYTYQDLYEEMVKAKEVLGEGFYGYSFSNADYEQFYIYARQNGEQFYNDKGTSLGFKPETLINYFKYVSKLIEDEVTPPHSLVLEHLDLSDSLVARGEVALQVAASNQIVGVQSGTEDEIGLIVLPSLENGEHGNWIRPSQSLAINSNTENAEEAAMFIDFMTNNLEANEILAAERGVPISSEVRDHIYDKLDASTQKQFAFLESLAEYSKPADPLPPPGETEVRAAFMRIAEMINYGQVTSEEATEQFMNEANKILSD
ncbi:ABC transporter substrate-binding protein [Gracilibacillus sp. D59]|uniref:ABC transporter substrate-binding protein n=1 Tax=Gracilibacillus sp. D59 TaxID=3457434 RepID=UPI003FCCF631